MRGLKLLSRPSPNYGPRRDAALPDMVVIHYTAMQTAAAALERLCDPQAEVSAHYLICDQGQIWQMVAEDQRAWHAGAGRWGATRDVNSRSIGIELANRGDHPFAASQMDVLEQLLAQVMARWAIVPERIIGHSDMAPVRKSDPGARFDWLRLARQGLGIWPDGAAPDIAAGMAAGTTAPCRADRFMQDAARFGYHPPADCDDPVAAVLAAFRLRFRPQAQGALDCTDCALIADLAQRYPVDRATRSA